MMFYGYVVKRIGHEGQSAGAAEGDRPVLAMSRRTLASVVLACSLVAGTAADPAGAAGDREIANALRAGGLIVVLRHGSTFRDQADTDPLHPDNVAAQRQLDDAGK